MDIHGSRKGRFEIEALEKDIFDGSVAIRPIDAGATTSRFGSLHWVLLQVAHDGLNGSQLQVDVIRVEDLLNVVANDWTDLSRLQDAAALELLKSSGESKKK